MGIRRPFTVWASFFFRFFLFPARRGVRAALLGVWICSAWRQMNRSSVQLFLFHRLLSRVLLSSRSVSKMSSMFDTETRLQLFGMEKKTVVFSSNQMHLSWFPVDCAGLPLENGGNLCFDRCRRHMSSGTQPGLWDGSTYESLLRKLEFTLQDDSVEEAWEAFSNFKTLHGFPEEHLVRKLIASLSYSSSTHWLRRAFELASVISEEKPDLVRCESFSRLALGLARAQMPVPASTVLRIMVERGKIPSHDTLSTLFSHLVKTRIGSHLAADVLIELCEYFLNRRSDFKNSAVINLRKPTITIFNIVLDSCVRNTSLIKAQQILELMARVGVVADAYFIVVATKIHEMMGERGDLKNLKVHIDGILSSAALNRQYCHFYDSLLSLHFKYNDVDAAAELMMDTYRRTMHLQSSKGLPAGTHGSQHRCYLQIGSSNLQTGSRIAIDPKKLENGFLFSAEKSHLAFVLFVDGKFVPSNKALAMLINAYVNERKVDKLSNFLINVHKKIGCEGADLCSEVLHACIMSNWLDTAHDILDDLELAKVPVGASSYVSLLNAYVRENMWEESKILSKQMSKVGLTANTPNDLCGSTCAAKDASVHPPDEKIPDSLKKGELVQFLELEDKEYNFEAQLVYEFNSSILFFCKAKMMEDALLTLKRMMQKNIQPTALTYSYLVNGYSSLKKYRDITILWGEIRRQMEYGGLSADRDLYDCLLLNFLKGGYFGRVIEIIDYMIKHNMYVDKLKCKREFLKYHKALYRRLKASECRTDAQKRRLEDVLAFKNWAGIDRRFKS